MAAPTAGWVEGLLAGSERVPPRAGLDARVALIVDGARTVLDIRDGRFAPVADGGAEPAVEVPLSAEQVDAIAAGELSLAVAYMRGDIKPVGSTGALAVLIEVVEDPATWAGLRP